MTTIVFVDDNNNILDAMKGSLRILNPDWTIHFRTSAREAIELMKAIKVDCVVSDICMPEMSGTQLLSHVAKHHPHILRIAMSGYLNEEIILESLYVTHRFIAKPGRAAEIADAIQRSFVLHEQLDDPELKSLIAGITSLPVLPEIYDQLMKVLASDNYSAASIGKIIESDISLSATLLKVVNSAYYGLAQQVESPAHAAQLLGADIVKNILLSEKIVSQFKDMTHDTKRIIELNQQANVRGALSSRMAQIADLNKRQIDHSHMAGIMSNLGELIMETHLKGSYDGNGKPHNPDKIGGSIIGLWSLSDNIVDAILHQRDPNPVPKPPNGRMSAPHVLQALRQMETAFTQNGEVLDENFTASSVLAASSADSLLKERWFGCFCDYHREMQLAN